MKITLENIKSLYTKFVKKLKATNYKNPIFWVKFSAYAIPVALLFYVLYYNFLPFGYQKTFRIEVGSPSDTSGEFYLEPSRDLSERISNDQGAYRKLDGLAYATLKPKAALQNTKLKITVEGDNVSIIPPYISLNPDSYQWDYNWDFSKQIPKELSGNAFNFDNATVFDGNSRLELPNSQNKFEANPFTAYIEWTPKDETGVNQEIIGHFNWEIFQSPDNITFQVGRLNDENGGFKTISKKIDKSFFGKKHTLIASYDPDNSGTIMLMVDNKQPEIAYLQGNKIWADYGKDNNFSIGWSPHNYGKYPHFSGLIYSIKIVEKKLINFNTNELTYFPNASDNTGISFGLVGNNGIIRKVNVELEK